MSRVPSTYTRLFLRHVGWEASRTDKTVRDLLREYATGKIQETATGMAVVSVAADGVATTYAMPSPTVGLVLSPESLADMISTIWDQIEDLDATNTPDLDGEALLSALRGLNRPIRTLRPGFHLMPIR
jgi:hypothetical protein